MNTESQQQEWIVRLTEGLRRKLALLTGTKALLCAGQKLGEVHLVKVAEAHNAALTAERQRQDAVLSKTYELHKAEVERLKADYTRELNAKLEQINKQAETIRDERARRETAEDIQHGEKLILLEEISKNKLLSDSLLSALAAIEKHNKAVEDWKDEAAFKIDVDLSLLHEHDAEVRKTGHFMNQNQTTIAGERTHDTGDHKQTNDQPQPDSLNPGSERGGYLYNGKTATEWFQLHEVMRNDLARVLEEKEELRQDYGRAIEELEAQASSIRKHEEHDADRLSKLHPHGTK